VLPQVTVACTGGAVVNSIRAIPGCGGAGFAFGAGFALGAVPTGGAVPTLGAGEGGVARASDCCRAIHPIRPASATSTGP
jgi:hypothetical protein